MENVFIYLQRSFLALRFEINKLRLTVHDGVVQKENVYLGLQCRKVGHWFVFKWLTKCFLQVERLGCMLKNHNNVRLRIKKQNGVNLSTRTNLYSTLNLLLYWPLTCYLSCKVPVGPLLLFLFSFINPHFIISFHSLYWCIFDLITYKGRSAFLLCFPTLY